MTQELKYTHDGIEIVYREMEDMWCFELRGRERKADSLRAAKEAIDKPEPKAKNACKPVPGVLFSYAGKSWRPVMVTSVAEGTRWGSGKEVWISANGQRSKVNADGVFAATDANDAIRSEHDRIQAEIDALDKKKEVAYRSLQKVDLSTFGE